MAMLPLSGCTVVALEQAVAAPFATRQLADLGARVIKVERPGTGDFARGYDTTVKGMCSHFVWLNRSKESLTLDLKQPAARQVLKTLLATSDIFVHNLAPDQFGEVVHREISAGADIQDFALPHFRTLCGQKIRPHYISHIGKISRLGTISPNRERFARFFLF